MNTQEMITKLDSMQKDIDELRNYISSEDEKIAKCNYINEKYTYKQIYNICHNHEAKEHFTVDDQLKVDNVILNKKSIIFDVVDVKDNSITLVTHYLVAQMPFDAAESNNPDEFIAKYGSNNYEQSSIRQWLNSAEASGNWWKPQNSYDKPVANLNYMDGFLFGIDKSFVNVLTKNELGDKFWLLSEDEVEILPFFVNKENRIKQYLSGEKDWWWLRTPHFDYNSGVHDVFTSGGSNYSYVAYYAIGVAPACRIVG